MSRLRTSVRCAHWWEREIPDKRYVAARGQCKRLTAHPSHYCKEHRYRYRWSDEQEAAYQRSRRSS